MATGTQIVSKTLITKGSAVPQSLSSPNALRQSNKPLYNSVAKDLESLSNTINSLHGVLSTVAPTISQIISLQNTAIRLSTSSGSIFLDPSVPAITLTSSASSSKIVLDATVPSLTLFDQAGTASATLTNTQESPLAITATTGLSPDTITVPGNTYLNGDTLHIENATGDTAINGYRIVEGASGATFKLTDLSGNPINGNGAYAGGGTATRYYSGLLAQTVALGNSFSDFRLRLFADGQLVIAGASLDGSNISGGGITSIAGSGGNVLTLTIENGLMTIQGTGSRAGTGDITIDGIVSAKAYKANGSTGGTASFTAGPLGAHTFTFVNGLFIS